jgi:hypothetical protein
MNEINPTSHSYNHNNHHSQPEASARYRPMEPPQTPIKVFEIDNIRASIFRRNDRDEAGHERRGYQVSFGRRYQRNGAWKTSYTFEPQEIAIALQVLMLAKNYLDRAVEASPSAPYNRTASHLPQIDALETDAMLYPEVV